MCSAYLGPPERARVEKGNQGGKRLASPLILFVGFRKNTPHDNTKNLLYHGCCLFFFLFFCFNLLILRWSQICSCGRGVTAGVPCCRMTNYRSILAYLIICCGGPFFGLSRNTAKSHDNKQQKNFSHFYAPALYVFFGTVQNTSFLLHKYPYTANVFIFRLSLTAEAKDFLTLFRKKYRKKS